MLEKDKNYSNLQEEVETQRVVIMHLRKRYKQFKAEIEDIERDYEHRQLEYIAEIRR